MSKEVARHGDSLVWTWPYFAYEATIEASAVSTEVNSRKVARVGDKTSRHLHYDLLFDEDWYWVVGTLIEGSNTVKAEGQGVCRIGDAASCGCKIITGSPDTFAE